MVELTVKVVSAELCEAWDKSEGVASSEPVTLVYSISSETEICDETNSILSEGELYITEKSIKILPRGRALTVRFCLSGVEMVGIFDRGMRPSPRQRRQLVEILREAEGLGNGDKSSEKIVENSLSTLLLLLLRKSDPSVKDELLCDEVSNDAQGVRHYLLENYTSRVTLDSLCFLFRTNKTALCREFKREYGVTVMGYLNGIRISEAKRLLCEDGRSVTEIAGLVGFETIHYFSRLFKRVTGMTPIEYRRGEEKMRTLLDS